MVGDQLTEYETSANHETATQRKYSTFVTHLRDLDILEAYSLKPLLDGKTLAKALSTPPGPWMKDALDVVMAWQLRHPDVKDPTEAIEEVKKHGELTSALASHFLKLTIRPLFAKAKPDSVTEQGRKKVTADLPAKMTAESSDERLTKPWKNEKESHALALLHWVVHSLDSQSTERLWPLLVPPILTLVDDWETKHKRHGASLLHSLLHNTPPTLLTRTGLGPVFEDALLPCLTYLPPLTPAPDSAAILNTAYPALLTLTATRFPPSDPTTTTPRLRALDKHLRTALLHSLAHAGQYPLVAATLLAHLPPLLDALALDTVKHLQYLLPPLRDALTNAARARQREVLLAALEALRAVLRNAWPRIGEHRVVVLGGLTGAWLDLEGEGMAEVREGLRGVAEMLVAAVGVEGEGELRGWCVELVRADGRLGELFEKVLEG